MWSVLEVIPCSLEKNVSSALVGWSVLYMSVGSCWSIVFFKCYICLLIFNMAVLPITESEALEFPTIIVLLFLTLVVFKVCFIYLSSLIFYIHICKIHICILKDISLYVCVYMCTHTHVFHRHTFPANWPLWNYIMSFVSCDSFCLEFYFVFFFTCIRSHFYAVKIYEFWKTDCVVYSPLQYHREELHA